MRFHWQNGLEFEQVRASYMNAKVMVLSLSWMVDVVLQDTRVLYRINKDEGDECSLS